MRLKKHQRWLVTVYVSNINHSLLLVTTEWRKNLNLHRAMCRVTQVTMEEIKSTKGKIKQIRQNKKDNDYCR